MNFSASPAPQAFQINRDSGTSTGDQSPTKAGRLSGARWSPRGWAVIETSLIFLIFAAVAGQLPPDVNESHYLTKAKHFWNPDWCPGDLFLASSFSHWLFYVAFGWLTKFMSLSAFAWTGRLLTWAALAFAWQRLSRSLIQLPLFSILSATLFVLLNERFHMAGEWIVGGFEAKGFAYAFVILALEKVAERKWHAAWPLLGVASLLHVLVGGWALLATSFAFVFCSRPKQGRGGWGGAVLQHVLNHWQPIFVAGGLILAAALPPLLADQSADSETATIARSIYVNFRISHHLTFAGFPTRHVARFSLLIAFGICLHVWLQKDSASLSRRIQPLVWFAAGTLGISYGGLLLSGFAEQSDAASAWAAGLLRFYWFRIADFSIPAVLSLSCCLVLSKWLMFGPRIYHRAMPLVVTCLVAAATALMVSNYYADPRPMADGNKLPTYDDSPARTIATWQNWKRACYWIRDNTPEDAIFITPAEQHTFKWYAGRHEVVCWKDVPQDAAGIIEWRQRIAVLHEPQTHFANGILQYTDAQLLDLAKKYAATHLLVPQYQVDLTPGGTELKQVYPVNPNEKSTYAVFEFHLVAKKD